MADNKPKQKKAKKTSDLPPIPEKMFFSIGEVGHLCELKPHVLRYWEQEFQQLSPAKRSGNRRYYERKDVLMIREIRSLLYDHGYTIEGARAKLASNSHKAESTNWAYQAVTKAISDLENVLDDLEEPV